MSEVKKYSKEYKEEALKLVNEKGCKNASEELGISYSTLYEWVKLAKKGELHLENRSVENVSALETELQEARKLIKELEKRNKELEETNEVLAEATAFFARSRQKSAKQKG